MATSIPSLLRRSFLLQTLALAAAPVWLAACSRERTLALGIHPWIGYESIYLAREFGWLPTGIDLHEGKVAQDTLAALQAGRLDAACLTLDEVLSARAAGVALTVVLVFDVSAGADVLLARPGIPRLEDLAGKRIAVERSAVGGLMLAQALEAAGLAAEAVTVLDLRQDAMPDAWRAGRIDAAICYEPTASLLRREGAVALFDSRRLPDTIYDVLAVRGDRLPGREEALRALIAAHFRGLEHVRRNREDALYRIAQRQGVHVAEVRRALAGVSLPDAGGNRHHFMGPLDAAARRLNALMVQHGLLPRTDGLQALFDPSHLPGESGAP